MTITLAQLRTGARQRADMENSEFITDSELTNYVNSEIAELKDLLISAYDSDYDLQSVTFSTANGTSTYALPNGTNYSAAPAFYKLRGVDAQIGSEWKTLSPFNFNERNKNAESAWDEFCDPRYRLAGSNLMFSPAPTGVYSVKLWYIPVATKLSADGDTLDDLNQYSEYVMVGAAIKMLIKEESDPTVLMAQKAALAQRIVTMAQNRDAGGSEAVSDVYAENSNPYFRG
jgi:hypothetical protein